QSTCRSWFKMNLDINLDKLSLQKAYSLVYKVNSCAKKEADYYKFQKSFQEKLMNEYKDLRRITLDNNQFQYSNFKKDLDSHIAELEKNKTARIQAIELRKSNNKKDPARFNKCSKIANNVKGLSKKLEVAFENYQQAPHNKTLQKEFLSLREPLEKHEAESIKNSCGDFYYGD